MDSWGPADWAVVGELIGALVIIVVVFACSLPDAWSTLRETFRKPPPSDPRDRVPYRRRGHG